MREGIKAVWINKETLATHCVARVLKRQNPS